MQPGPDSRALNDLLAVLYGEAAPGVAEAIAGAVHLLTPITVRAEAWLCAWEDRPSWGGARRGAGRQRTSEKHAGLPETTHQDTAAQRAARTSMS